MNYKQLQDLGYEIEENIGNLSTHIGNIESLIRILENPGPEQKSPEWYDLRMQMLTASSDIPAIAGQCYNSKKRKWSRKQVLDQLYLKKCGKGPQFTSNRFTLYGNKMEDVSLLFYRQKTGATVYPFGLLVHPEYPFIGASPDGITSMGRMVEIKNPQTRKITGEIPDQYMIQMIVQMEVCQLSACDYVETSFVQVSEMEYKMDENGSVVAIGVVELEDGFRHFYPQHIDRNQLECIQRQYKKSCLDHPMYIEYYRLNEYMCQTVERNKQFFEELVPQIEQAWDHILECRKDPSLLPPDQENDEHVPKKSVKNSYSRASDPFA